MKLVENTDKRILTEKTKELPCLIKEEDKVLFRQLDRDNKRIKLKKKHLDK